MTMRCDKRKVLRLPGVHAGWVKPTKVATMVRCHPRLKHVFMPYRRARNMESNEGSVLNRPAALISNQGRPHQMYI
jgi:hypothetical protein